MKYLIIILLILFPVFSYASTTINARVVRNQQGSGTCLISSGFPFPPGLVTEQMITDGTIRIHVNHAEVPANISALRGRHNDGSLRSALIQFTLNMKQGDTLIAQILVGGSPRSFSDPKYIRPTWDIVQNDNVILPTDPDYITTTRITFRGLLPVGKGTADEEKQYTNLAKNRFDALAISNNDGTAEYEDFLATLNLWARTGEIKYFDKSIKGALEQLAYMTPGNSASPECNAEKYTNPDGRRPASDTYCGLPAEWHFSRVLTFASMYLMTGYRDFWSLVAYNVQNQQSSITCQEIATQKVIERTNYDMPRFNYASRYGALIAAAMIDATFDIPGQYYHHRKMIFSDQFKWTLQAIINTAWNFKWVPFDSGSGTVPAYDTLVSVGSVTANLLGVYSMTGERHSYPGALMPTTGFLQVNNIQGGDFSSGKLSGISANVKGPSISDYRIGLTGSRSNSPRDSASVGVSIPVFQLVFPCNFLIDYYLNIDADSRIPGLVKANLNIILNQIKMIQSGDPYYGVNGGVWGNPVYEKPYSLKMPIASDTLAPYELPEYARIIAFVLKTSGEDTVNGATYSTWYSRIIDTANNCPKVLTWEWKLFGQFYAWGMDAPWIMKQTLLSAPKYRESTYYSDIPGDVPDLARATH